MDSFRISCFFFNICVFLLIKSGSSELVPVYMWETAKSNEIVPAIGHINTATFKEILLQKIEKTNPFIVAFAEQSLSPEDFNDQNERTFSHLSKLGKTAQVSYFPLVENPINAIKDLPSHKTTEISLHELITEAKIPESRVLIVDLNDAKDEEDRINMLKRHDSIILEAYEKLLKEHKQVLAIYTGSHASWVVPEQITHQRETRETTDDPESYTSTNFLMYLANPIQYKSGTKDPEELVISKIENNNDTLTIITDKDNIVFDIHSPSAGYWSFSSVAYKSINVSLTHLYAPRTFSYHCSALNYSTGESETLESLYFPGFQIQYFPEGVPKPPRFDDAYDCVGFTSTPIWSGLFITFILALIMTLGLTMMMDIKTMDRFDDPKGKTIIINVAE